MKTRAHQLIRRFSILLLVSMTLSFTKAQPPDSLWYKEYGFVEDDIGFDAIEGEDGEYYVIGKTEVSTIIKGEFCKGTHEFSCDFSGFKAGIYFCKLEIENQVQVRRIIISR